MPKTKNSENIKKEEVVTMKHLKTNFSEIGKDFKGIGAGLIKTGASLFCLAKDTLRIPVSACKDIRDGVKRPLDDTKPEAKVVTCEVVS